jgi:hypothetical protein
MAEKRRISFVAFSAAARREEQANPGQSDEQIVDKILPAIVARESRMAAGDRRHGRRS